MSHKWTDYQLEPTEISTEAEDRNWYPAPASGNIVDLITIDPDGFAEIKPHNESGITKGLKELKMTTGKGRERPGQLPRTGRVLVTYLPVDKDEKPLPNGTPDHVRIFATLHDPEETPKHLVDNAKWQDLGSFKIRKTLDLRVEDADTFGRAVEDKVRSKLVTRVLKRQGHKLLGYARDGGADAWWELAQFYNELARELGDPFYGDLASELTTLGSGQAVLQAA